MTFCPFRESIIFPNEGMELAFLEYPLGIHSELEGLAGKKASLLSQKA